ncbi:uncharacterized protein LOC130730376 isoform X2 [Lotus japonicus]|uniref:uncharacterized protein LOC130730376 isoform X1 n=1 Tax=Lotus japonicus TaxID=34305 RepID=UPI0025852DFC|nr:uncharacterized protein LOC130730376 isoform X1 [Lotus japonicus]XP_057438354.1 uncharacterized protein LOC130730376 isoform X2 [Lotus japonicus]XP_057438356.1 uncharacterized protein LOC130730376 isoform X2 [Lotus japonicus]XP_057438357.1 uncharacterized protein LOC130730376 isoform X2 [Lotus japonicus]
MFALDSRMLMFLTKLITKLITMQYLWSFLACWIGGVYIGHCYEWYLSCCGMNKEAFSGCGWNLDRSSSTILSYEVNVIPRFNFLAIFLERIIRSDLPVNLRALAYRVERNIIGNQRLPLQENNLHKTFMPNTSLVEKINGTLCGSDKLPPGENKEGLASPISGSLPTSSSEVNSNWGVFGKVCRLDRPCVVDEVHLRRFDGLLENRGVHCCVVASITVKAPVRDVWNVLSSYETLPK